jgi:hypothetical protein
VLFLLVQEVKCYRKGVYVVAVTVVDKCTVVDSGLHFKPHGKWL